MKLDRLLALMFLLLLSFNSFGQETEVAEMADVLRSDGKIYTVVFGVVVILTAMIILLIRLDRKMFLLENKLNKGTSKNTSVIANGSEAIPNLES